MYVLGVYQAPRKDLVDVLTNIDMRTRAYTRAYTHVYTHVYTHNHTHVLECLSHEETRHAVGLLNCSISQPSVGLPPECKGRLSNTTVHTKSSDPTADQCLPRGPTDPAQPTLEVGTKLSERCDVPGTDCTLLAPV